MAKKIKESTSILPELSILLLTIMVLVVMIYINNIITTIGIKSLQQNLTNMNRDNSKQNFIGMIARYKLQKQFFENKITDEELSIKTLKINSYSVSQEINQKGETNEYEEFMPPFISFINAIRFITGQDAFNTSTNEQINQYLDIAFYYERNKLFKNALQVYAKALTAISEENPLVPIIELHEGFCISIIGDYEKARLKYKKVISENRNEETTKTAQILLSFIDNIENEIDKIKNSSEDPMTKGILLFKKMAYKDSIDFLNNATPKNQTELESIQYHKARSLEETGNSEQSVEIYQDIITQNPDSEFATLSNRRIIIISATNDNNEKLKLLADKNNEKIKDPEFSILWDSLKDLQNKSKNPALNSLFLDNEKDDSMLKQIKDNNSEMENEKKEFIHNIVDTVVNKNKSFSIKNITFYEEVIKKLEELKKELESKNAVLEREKKKTEIKLKSLLSTSESSYQTSGVNPDEVTKIDQFGRIIIKYIYKYKESGTRYLETYSIYSYSENDKLFKVVDYDEENKLLAYYLINYDEDGKQIEIRKYDAYDKLIYVK